MNMQTEIGRTDTIIRSFSGQRQHAHSPFDQAESVLSQAALRQLHIERLMGYGAHHDDAAELRGRVWAGESWQAVATDLAEKCLHPPELLISPESKASRAHRLYRASALIRMSQMMMVDNSTERDEIVARAAKLFEEAAQITGDCKREVFDTPDGPLVGWRFPSQTGETFGRVVSIGGIEGWAMDFAEMGLHLAERGLEAVMLDGPGQGESRTMYKHFLSPTFETAYAAVFDALDRAEPSLPIGFIGNSMGGSVGMHLARLNKKIAALCNNGGATDPARERPNRTIAQKLAAHVGDVSIEESRQVWGLIAPLDTSVSLDCPLLVVHGGLDPLVPLEDAKLMFDSAESRDKHFVVFDDADHCIYKHADERDALICDWMLSRLKTVNA